jgi:hypothetical protein
MTATLSKYIKNHGTKSILTCLLGLSILFTIFAPPWSIEPERNINAIISQIDAPGRYTTTNGYLHLRSNSDYVLTFYVGLESQYAPIQYITVSRTGEDYFVDLIQGPGHENVVLLQHQDAKNYIETHNVPIARLEAKINQLMYH